MTSYWIALSHLVELGYISKVNISISAIYELTVLGRKVLEQYYRQLELYIKEYVLKYGNGL